MSFRDITTDCMSNIERKQVLWIRIGFNADPDLALYLNEDPDPDPRSQCRKWVIKHLRRHISIIERLEIRLISKFWSIYLLLVPDPGEPNQCGSGSTRLVNTHQFQDESLKFVFIIFLFM
jgi:hypothetical protein